MSLWGKPTSFLTELTYSQAPQYGHLESGGGDTQLEPGEPWNENQIARPLRYGRKNAHSQQQQLSPLPSKSVAEREEEREGLDDNHDS